MTRTVFACTYMEKLTERDSFESGCDPETKKTADTQGLAITAATMPELIKSISRSLCLDCETESWFIPVDDGVVSFMSFNRLENNDSDKPTAKQDAAWRSGELDLWLADYMFTIEKRIVSPVSPEDLQGVRFHE